MRVKKSLLQAVAGILILSAIGAPAEAQSLANVIAQGRPVIDLRARYENVDDAGKGLTGEAETLRARLGYETGSWNNLQLALDFDQVWTVGGATYNSTRNGKVLYPAIADPAMTALNRLQLSYASNFDTKFTIGRQRLLIGNQRFVGNSGWRQHEQTFDSVSLVNSSIPQLTVTYAYLYRINRIGSPALPAPSNTAAAATGQASYFKSDSHVMDAVYTGIDHVRLEAYSFLLDLKAPAYASLPLQQTASSKLSTATYGLRGDFNFAVSADMAGKLTGEYAHQTDYADNPLSYGVNYWLGEASLSYAGLTGLAGYEVLGGNGAIGFSTPLATLHLFNRWADMFLTTPNNGLKDFYLKAAYGLPADVIAMKSLTGTLVYHSYQTDKLGKGIGSEWDAQAELAIDANASLLLKYADYQGSGVAFGGFPDKSVLWLQAAYKY